MPTDSFPRPQFDDGDLPLSDAQLGMREDWMMEQGNWREDHSIPSVGKHYRYMWKWDSLKAVVINARRGDPDRAALEFTTLEKYRDPQTGFVPNKIFATADHKTWRDYPEALNFNNNKVGTSYTQPPIAAWAAIETCRGFQQQGRASEGLLFLEAVYGTAEEGNYTGLQGESAYFINHRQNSPGDSLVAVVHPNETGRDSDEANKPWLVYGDRTPGTVREWLHMQMLGRHLGKLGRDSAKQRIDWIPEQVRPEYWVNDVMLNAMHASNLRYLADIAGTLSDATASSQKKERYQRDTLEYQGIADQVETEILDRMWDPEQGFFYNLDGGGKQIPVDSITGLFPLMLDNISEDKIVALLDKLEDPTWFATTYPVPTHAARSRFYNPDPAGLKDVLTPPWSGKVWIDANHFLVEEGLVPRAATFADPEHRLYNPALARRLSGRAGIIAAKTTELLAMNLKSMECYSPNTGKGVRVEDFMWSNLGRHFENYDQAEKPKSFRNLP